MLLFAVKQSETPDAPTPPIDANNGGDAPGGRGAQGGEDAPPPFPADTRALSLPQAQFALPGARPATRLRLANSHHSVLHIRLSVPAELKDWLQITPGEIALGPGEAQTALVTADADKARAALRLGASPLAPLTLSYQRLFPSARGQAPSPTGTDIVTLRLPLAACPHCARIVDENLSDGIPDVCPYCFERLRPCPVCGAPNSWLARRCILDDAHVIRESPDWGMLGGGTEASGYRQTRVPPTLSRRWSYPSVPTVRRDAQLAWSAPVAAYGLVAASASTTEGETHLYAFDVLKGAPLWEPYPLPDPVYPERGGPALADGNLFAATVEGTVLCLDALRGTRVWEAALPPGARVFGAVLPVTLGERKLLYVPAALQGVANGVLYALDARTGNAAWAADLPGPPDVAPAFANNRVFIHDDNGNLSALDALTGAVLWRALCGAGFDAAPVVTGNFVYSATAKGVALCHRCDTGALVWTLAVTNAPFSGTPACDGTLLYLPAGDGLHIVSVGAGKAVKRLPSQRPIRSAPVVSGNTLFYGSTDGNVYASEAGRGVEAAYQTGGVGSQIIAAPALADDALFVTATNGALYALSLGVNSAQNASTETAR